MGSPRDSDAKVWFSQRGIVHLPLGGEDRTLRFRTHEIRQLERELGRSVLDALANPSALGFDFMHIAITVGVAHQFIGAKRKKKKPLTEAMVDKWIDECDGEDGNLSFEELNEAVIKAVVGGMPNGQAMLDAMNNAGTDDDDDDDGEGDGGPSPDRAVDPMSLLRESTGQS